MRNKKVIILIVLAAVAAGSLISGIAGRPKGRAKKAYSAADESAQISPQAAVPAQRRAKRSAFSSWNRNPFAPQGVLGTTSSLALSGILRSGTSLKAMIGNAIVAKGDKVGINTVVDIQKDRVILNDGTKDFTLKLKE